MQLAKAKGLNTRAFIIDVQSSYNYMVINELCELFIINYILSITQ